MKPAAFKYLAPRCAEEAIEFLVQYHGTARLLAGGQSLIPLMNFRMARPAALIDLARCTELSYIRHQGEWLAIGPMTRQSEAEHSAEVKSACPLVADAMPLLGTPTIRNRGTIGGTLAHADRVAELPGVAVALGAQLVAQSPNGQRTIAAADFFVADLTNALDANELLREIRIPITSRSNRYAFVEATNRHHDLATVGLAINLKMAIDETCESACMVAVGIGPTPVRLTQCESRLQGSRVDVKAIESATHAAIEESQPQADFHASAEYRRLALGGLVKRGLHIALKSAAYT